MYSSCDKCMLCDMQKYAGASIAGAVKLNQAANDVVINWSGGLHHAKKSEVGQFMLCTITCSIFPLISVRS